MVGASAAPEMSLFDHLDELRSVLFACLWVLVLLTAAAWAFSRPILDHLVQRTVGHAQFIQPLEGFSTRMKLSLLLALIAGLPFFAAQIWGFVVPGLLQRERRYVLPIAFWSTVLFLIGVAFSTFALTPTMLRILMSFGTETIRPSIAVGYLLDFFFKMALACGLLFQLPLVVAVLSFVGLVTPQFLTAKWRHAVVIILIVAAIVTPGDGPSQLVLAVPIVILYFISIWISAAIHRGKRRREAETAPRDGDAPGPDGTARRGDWSI
jgi:sec-independent protein translocase protein TatC